MTWTTPATVAVGSTGEPTDWNTFVCDNATYLKTEVDKLDDISRAGPSRAFDTVYQNTSGKIRFIEASVYLTAAGEYASMVVSISTTNSAPSYTDAVIQIDLINSAGYYCISGVIPPYIYYKLEKGGTPELMNWTEWDLH